MYSYEIENYIKLRNYLLTLDEYCDIIASSPQIDHIIYKDDLFHIHTEDNYHFKIKLKTRLQS